MKVAKIRYVVFFAVLPGSIFNEIANGYEVNACGIIY